MNVYKIHYFPTMKQQLRLLPGLLMAMFLFAGVAAVAQPVSSYNTKTSTGTHVLEKEVPQNPGALPITGKGVPTELFVVQLARFEELPYIPETFPAGTMLWPNPDHQNEKLLLVGFFDTFEDAQKAAVEWKKKPMYKSAFPRKMPFIVRYD
jgi:hypothetical protein